MTSSDSSLQGWKEIANALGVDVRTAQRWERLAGLPVRRLPQFERGPVYAIKSEIGFWQSRFEVTRQQTRAMRHAAPAPDTDRLSRLARAWHYITRATIGLFLASR